MKKKKREKRFRKTYTKKIKKPFYKKKIFINSIIVLCLLIIFSYFFIFFHFFSIKEIKIEGNQDINTEDLISFLNEKSIKNFLFLESKSIFLFIPSAVSSEIILKFPKILSFSLRKDYPNTLNLKIIERRPIGTWCQEECFFFDNSGKIFEKTEKKKGIIIKTENKRPYLGKQIFSLSDLELIIFIWNNINPEIGISEIEILNSEINILTKEGWHINFNPNDDIEFQITKLYLTLEEKIPQEKRSSIDYIDLRFDRKIYFKYKDEGLVNIVDED